MTDLTPEELELIDELLRDDEQVILILIEAGYDPAEVRRKARALVDAAIASSPVNPKNRQPDSSN